MEWDGVLTSDNYVFLCFAKHKMPVEVEVEVEVRVKKTFHF